MFVTNWISTTKIQKISEITNFFRHYFLSRTEVTTPRKYAIKLNVPICFILSKNSQKIVSFIILTSLIFLSNVELSQRFLS